jgi:Rrp7 RRM-like N-terminal domain
VPVLWQAQHFTLTFLFALVEAERNSNGVMHSLHAHFTYGSGLRDSIIASVMFARKSDADAGSMKGVIKPNCSNHVDENVTDFSVSFFFGNKKKKKSCTDRKAIGQRHFDMPKDKTKSAKSGKKITSSGLQDFCGFKILPIHMNRDAVHYMYIKKHESRLDSEATPKDRTLFILNLPVDTTDEHIKRLFQPYGRVVSIKYHTRGNHPEEDEEEAEAVEEVETAVEQPKLSRKKQQKLEEEEKQKKESDPSLKIRNSLTTGSFAHVVLLEAKELENVLNMISKKREWTEDDEAMLPLGFDREYVNEWEEFESSQLMHYILL